jgi:hypothetical protein
MAVDKKISQLASGAPAQAGDEYVVARSGANYKLTLTNIAASMPATTITTGNLTFSSTAQRITGDMSNATLSSRLTFQTSTTNGATVVSAIPNGTGTITQFAAYGGSDPANAQVFRLDNRGGTESRLDSTYIGTPASGTYLPMTFYTGGSERVRIDTSGNMGIGLSSLTIPLQIGKGGGGNPATSGTTQTYGIARIGSSGAAALDVGTYAAGQVWMQGVNVTNLATNYDLVLQPNGGNVGIGTASPVAKLDIISGTARVYISNQSASGFITAVNTTNTAYAPLAINGSELVLKTGDSTRATIDSSGNVGIGGTAATAFVKCQINGTLPTSGTLSIGFSQDAAIPSGTTALYAGFNSAAGTQAASFTLTSYAYYRASQGTFGAGSAVTNQFGYLAESTITGAANNYGFYGNIASGSNRWNFYAAGTALNYMAGGLGVKENIANWATRSFAASNTGAGNGVCLFINDDSGTNINTLWNKATSGNNKFEEFATDAGATLRGSIDYDRTGGLVRYNTTSDYRAKTIIGPVTNSGELVDALKVYVGKMNGATVERPMLIAHEAQEVAPYAVSGEKDAVDKDGKPVYQQIDVSSLVPLLLAEVKSLRQRVAELEAK